MTIQPIGAASVALYLTPADLKEHGLTPESLTRELALTLTRDAFLRAGLPAEGPLEIEAYPDACGVLVFARRSEPPRIWLAFPDLEGPAPSGPSAPRRPPCSSGRGATGCPSPPGRSRPPAACPSSARRRSRLPSWTPG